MRTCFLGLTWVQPPVLPAVPHSGSSGMPAHCHSDPQAAALGDGWPWAGSRFLLEKGAENALPRGHEAG